MKFCPECGAKLFGSKFCPECGMDLRRYIDIANNTNNQASAPRTSAASCTEQALAEREAELLAPFLTEKHQNGKYAIISLKDKTEMTVIVPDCVEIIGDGAFEGSGIMQVSLPEGLIKIGKRAFADCKELESINLPSTLRVIGYEAFSWCVLLDVTAPAGIRIGEDAFANTVPDVKQKEEMRRRKKAESKRMAEENRKRWEEAIRKEREEAEKKRKEEEEARKRMEEEQRRRMEEARRQYPYTEGLEFSLDNFEDIYYYYSCHRYSGSDDTVVIPERYIHGHNYGNFRDAVQRIDSDAFRNCKILKSVSIPVSIRWIGFHAFEGCSSLVSIKYNGSVQQWRKISKGSGWDFGTGNYTVYCTDGHISKQQS